MLLGMSKLPHDCLLVTLNEPHGVERAEHGGRCFKEAYANEDRSDHIKTKHTEVNLFFESEFFRRLGD